jgi:hypothetical protein
MVWGPDTSSSASMSTEEYRAKINAWAMGTASRIKANAAESYYAWNSLAQNPEYAKSDYYRTNLKRAKDLYSQAYSGETELAQLLREQREAKLHDRVMNNHSLRRGVENAYQAMEGSCRNAGELALVRSIKTEWINAMSTGSIPNFNAYLNLWASRAG